MRRGKVEGNYNHLLHFLLLLVVVVVVVAIKQIIFLIAI